VQPESLRFIENVFRGKLPKKIPESLYLTSRYLNKLAFESLADFCNTHSFDAIKAHVRELSPIYGVALAVILVIGMYCVWHRSRDPYFIMGLDFVENKHSRTE
jgi:hypothetical protein